MKTTYPCSKSLLLSATVIGLCTAPLGARAQSSLTFNEWAIPGPSGSTSETTQQQWLANVEQFIFTGQPVGTPGTATYAASIGSGPVTSVPANEPVLAFVIEVTCSSPSLLMSDIDWGITQPNATFTGTFSPDQGTYGGSGIGWTTGAGGTKTFTSDANTPVNGIILGGVGFNMTMAPQDSSSTDPFLVTALYSFLGGGDGAGLTVPFELADQT